MLPPDTSLAILWVAAVSALVGGMAVLVVSRLLARREGGAAVREIVRAIEDLTEGSLERLPPVDETEPLAPVGAALAPLAESVRQRTAEHERALASLRGVLDHCPGVGFIGTDTDGRVTYWSEGARELLGYAPEEVGARPVTRLFTEDAWQTLLPKLARREVREGRGFSERIRMRRRGGGEIAVIASVSAIAEGPHRGFFYSLRDGTETETLERELRESEEKYRHLAEGLAEGVVVLKDGLFIYANRALERLLGAGEGALLGTRFKDLVASEDLLRVMSLVAAAEAGAAPVSFDCRLRPANGGPPVEAQVTLSSARLSGHPAVVGSIAEVGAARRAWKQLQVSEARLDATLDATSDGILMLVGLPGRQRAAVVNRRVAGLLGVVPAEIFEGSGREIALKLGATLREKDRFVEFYLNACAGQDVAVELFETATDAGRVLEVYSAPATGRDESVVGRVFSFRDVTGREDLARSKRALEQANLDLSSLNEAQQQRAAELDRLNQELRSLDQMKSALLANVSHELQTPLVSIKGYTEMILKGRLGSVTEEQKRGLEISLRNIDRLIGMIDNLLSLARSEKETPLQVSSFPLWDLVEECAELVRSQAEARKITLTTSYMTEDLTVKADRARISQVFFNLLSNAIKFNKDGGQIQLTVRRGKRGYLIVEVRDTGVGIPSDSLERIFDRHYKVPRPGGAPTEGAGLGLSITRDILRLHGCTVRADSKPDEGSVFTFTLPLAASAPESEAGGSQEGGERNSARTAFGNGRGR